MALINYGLDGTTDPKVKLLCGCGNQSSNYLWGLFHDNVAAYIIAINIAHYRHIHTPWDRVWPVLTATQYSIIKAEFNLRIKIELLELLERHRALYLMKGFDALERAEEDSPILNQFRRSIIANF